MTNDIPANLKYSKEHEWLKISNDGKSGKIGITNHAQSSLGDIVYIELPDIGDDIEKKTTLGTIESVKAVSTLYSPINGEIIEINQELVDNPEKINSDPYGSWLVKIKIKDTEEIKSLMDDNAYKIYLSSQSK